MTAAPTTGPTRPAAALRRSSRYVQKIDFPGEPPKVRDATTPFNTTYYYATPTLGLGHRYISHTGKSDFPLDAWVTIAASNTVEGTQTIPVKGQWSINITDATPGSPGNPANYANDAVTATVPPVVLPLKGTRWTPTGAGPVEFTIAQPGKLGIVQIESEGYDRVGYNQPLNVRPFGSVFVRAGTEAYGASNDCIPGAVSLVNSQIAANQTTYFFLDADPVTPDPLLGDPAAPGTFTNQGGAQKPVGLRGRFGFAFTPLPAIAAAPLPAAVPQPTVRPATFGSTTSVKPSKTGQGQAVAEEPEHDHDAVQGRGQDGQQVRRRQEQDQEGRHGRRDEDGVAQGGRVERQPLAEQGREDPAQAAQVGQGQGHAHARERRLGRHEDDHAQALVAVCVGQ